MRRLHYHHGLSSGEADAKSVAGLGKKVDGDAGISKEVRGDVEGEEGEGGGKGGSYERGRLGLVGGAKEEEEGGKEAGLDEGVSGEDMGEAELGGVMAKGGREVEEAIEEGQVEELSEGLEGSEEDEEEADGPKEIQAQEAAAATAGGVEVAGGGPRRSALGPVHRGGHRLRGGMI